METIKKNKESIINYLKNLDSYDYVNDYIDFNNIAASILNDSFEIENLNFNENDL